LQVWRELSCNPFLGLMKPLTSSEDWDLIRAFPDHKTCSEALALTVKERKETLEAIVGPAEVGGINRVVVFENGVTRFDHAELGGGIITESFYCLPDTMNPRSPKP